MNNKVRILVASIVIALIVIIVGVFIGNNELKDNSNKESVTSNDNSTTDQNETQSSSETTTTIEETTIETETQTEPQTTTHQGISDNDIDPNKPMIALTFDDGPDGLRTGKLLDALEQNGVRATFFVVGTTIPGDEEIIKRASSIGCEIGNHSQSHKKLTQLDDASIANEIHPLNETIKYLTGQSNVLCRPPYGSIDERVMGIIDAPIILWSIDTMDWKTKDANQTVLNIQQSVQDGDIILMHDIHDASIEAAIQIIPWLKEQGYQLVTVSEMAYYKRGGLTKGVKYGSIR